MVCDCITSGKVPRPQACLGFRVGRALKLLRFKAWGIILIMLT